MSMHTGPGWAIGHLAIKHPLVTCCCVGAAAVGWHYGGSEAPMVAVTWDDAFMSQFEYGLPIARAMAVPGTLFVAPGLLDDDEVRYISINDVPEFRQSGWEIGAHSWAHEDLTEITEDEVRLSVAKAADYLLEAPTMAYPYGYENGFVQQIVSGRHTAAFIATNSEGGIIDLDEYELYALPRRVLMSGEDVDAACVTAAELTSSQAFVISLHGVSNDAEHGDYELTAPEVAHLLGCLDELRDAGEIRLVTASEIVRGLR